MDLSHCAIYDRRLRGRPKGRVSFYKTDYERNPMGRDSRVEGKRNTKRDATGEGAT